MKHAVGAIVTLLMIGIFSSLVVASVEESVSRTIELMDQAYRANTAQDAKKCIDKAEEHWKKHESFFGAVLRHDEIDSVIDSFALLKAYAAREDWDDYYGNCASLLARLEHISAKERLLLQNVM